MKRHLLSSLLLCSVSLHNVHASVEKKPNIILILMDDMGYGDLSLTGASSHLTPNIDQLAKEGLFFSQFYASQPVSSASRAGLLTGCYSNRIGFSGALMPTSRVGINPSEELIPELLHKRKYTCGAIGKWHIGHLSPFMPLQNGFDFFYGLPYSNDMWPKDFQGQTPAKKSPLARKLAFPSLRIIQGNKKGSIISSMEDQSKLTTLYTQKAVQFIQKNKDNPFFLYLAHSMPHVPLAVSEKFKGKSGYGIYGDVMMEIDWSVGEIMKTIHKNKLDENTLVIFTSDNGPWICFGNHGGSPGAFREGKLTSFEGGQRVPCLMRWKRKIPAGKICNALTSAIDLLPTISSICEAPLPQKKIDGKNLLPLMLGKRRESPHNFFYYYYGNNNLIAVRDNKFKLIFPHRYQTCLKQGKNGNKGIVGKKSIGLSLYNLLKDPGERQNVIDEYPKEVRILQRAADKMRKDLGDDLTRIPGKNRRKIGCIDKI